MGYWLSLDIKEEEVTRAVPELHASPHISCFHETLKTMTNPQALALLTPLCVDLDFPVASTDTPQVSPHPKCGPGRPSDGGFHEFMVQYFPAASGLNLEGAALLQGQPLFLRPCTLSGYPLAISEFSSHIHNPSFSCFLLRPVPPTHSSYFGIRGALSHLLMRIWGPAL